MQQGGIRHCHDQDPLSRARQGSIQREAGYTTRHASILCSSMSPGGGWPDWKVHRHAKITGISVQTTGGRTEKRGGPGMSRGEEANGDRGKPAQLVRRALKQPRWRAALERHATLHDPNSTASARLGRSPRQSTSYALLEAEGSCSSRGCSSVTAVPGGLGPELQVVGCLEVRR